MWTTSDIRPIGHDELRAHFQLCIVKVDVILHTTLDWEVDRGTLDDGGKRTKHLNILSLDCGLEKCGHEKIQLRPNCVHFALQMDDLKSDG